MIIHNINLKCFIPKIHNVAQIDYHIPLIAHPQQPAGTVVPTVGSIEYLLRFLQSLWKMSLV